MEGGNYLQGNLDIMKGQGLAKYVHYNEVSLYQGTFPYILLLVGRRISFLIPRTSFRFIKSRNKVMSDHYIIFFISESIVRLPYHRPTVLPISHFLKRVPLTDEKTPGR